MKTFDWSKPQRQPAAGLVVVFINTFWEVVKRVWPLLLLMLFGNKPGKIDRYEIMALCFLGFTIVSAVLRFFYFRFYMEDEKLIIKKGWLKKITKVIPFEKIQTVNIEKGPVHQALNIVKVSIETAGSGTTEGTIDAMHKSMAEALREKLLSRRGAPTVGQVKEVKPVVALNTRDLLKLSISANHLEALSILLLFFYGIIENFQNAESRILQFLKQYIPEGSVYPFLLIVVFLLVITILISTARIFFSFYQLSVFRDEKGFHIRSGLLNVKERLVNFRKIQFVSWRANWIRRLMGLWMFEYHIAGRDAMQEKSRVRLPVTQAHFISSLTSDYSPSYTAGTSTPLEIHPLYIYRRFLIAGLLPSLFVAGMLWFFQLQEYAFFLFFYLAIVVIISWLVKRKFRLWAQEDVFHIKKGLLGEERILMKWYKLQSVQLKQSIYQRKKGLASIVLFTAGGAIRIPFVPLADARQLMDYALYKTESATEHWM